MKDNGRVLIVAPNQLVRHSGQQYKIVRIIALDTVLAKKSDDGKIEVLQIKDLEIVPAASQSQTSEVKTELSLVSEKSWAEARRRYEIIFLLIGGRCRRTEREVAVHAANYGLHTTTIYRWIKLYEETGEVSSLLPNKSGFPAGLSKLSAEVDAIVKTAIETTYLNKSKHSVKAVMKEIERHCKTAGLLMPSEKTVRRKIALIKKRDQIARRQSAKRAKEEFDPHLGEFPHADYPLAVIQIDHTKLDLVIVDETYRLPIGRPWITVAIDVFSRMIVGFSVSLDAPANLSAGLCLTHAILPKETWLAKIAVEGDWACWGFPRTVHADNAGEFRGKMLRRACEEYGITLEWRPIGKPNYGGHIERLLGTFNTEIHDLPGTTFSSPRERGEYDSEKEAVFTLREIERWLATFIVGEYHVRLHEGINTAPLERWREGILGNDERPGIGLPPRVTDTEKLKLDFLPALNRTVQQYGVRLDEIHYNHDILKGYINARDEKDPKLKKQFVFKRDPRDISEIYFYAPEVKQYFAIPYRDTSRPPISLWELRETKNELKRQGKNKVNETLIFETWEKLRRQEEQATKLTKSARRKKEKRLLYQSVNRPADSAQTQQPSALDHRVEDMEDRTTNKIRPFEELEEI